MSFYKRDTNYVPSTIRAGNGIGGYLLLDDTLVANSWYRLMPESDTGTLVTDNDRKLAIGSTVLSGILEIEGWNLFILNAGYQQPYKILNHDRVLNQVELTEPIMYAAGLRAAGLTANVHYVIYPSLINPLGLNYSVGATDYIEIGVTREDLLAPTTIVKLDDIPPGELLMLHFERLDHIFYRFPTITTAAENNLGWGEHYKG